MLDKEAYGLKRMVKPEENVNIGNLRETFFYSMLNATNKVSYSDKTDFIVDDKYHFEIGGKAKSKRQISGLKEAYIVKDNIETGYLNQIPLWLFGFLY